MIIQARFQSTQSNLGYQFFDKDGTLLDARVTAGIDSGPETGHYLADATAPATSVGVYWNDTVTTDTAVEDLRDALLVAELTPTTIADAILKRGVDNTEGTADTHSLTELILSVFEFAIVGNTQTINKTDGVTPFNTRALGTNASADPIVSST